MAQKPIKKPSSKSSSTSTSSSSRITKKHLAVKPRKNAKAAQMAKMNKKFTAGLTAQTEKMLGERAGHLEMIGKGRSKSGAGGEKGKQGKKSGEVGKARKG